MAPSDQELALRTQVVGLAMTIFQAGTHYYWGAPDTGIVNMAANDFSDDEKRKHVLAASLDGTHFCAGRCDNATVKSLKQWSGANAAALAATSGTSAFRFPRYYLDGDQVTPSPSAAVYGESCTNKMHFDCASFVRYCFRAVLGAKILPPGTIMKAIATQIWPSPGGGGPTSITDVDVWPADILYTANDHHVGIATGGASYSKAAWIPSNQSIHAYYAKVGVIQTSISGPDPRWGIVRRWTTWPT